MQYFYTKCVIFYTYILFTYVTMKAAYKLGATISIGLLTNSAISNSNRNMYRGIILIYIFVIII